MTRKQTIEVQITAGTADIEEIYTERADIGSDNIISLHMVRAIGGKVNIRCRCGCKKLELIDKIPMSVFGHLRVKIRLPPKTKLPKLSKQFLNIEMKVIENIDNTQIRISNNTIRLLNSSKDYHNSKIDKRKTKISSQILRL